MVDLGGKKTRSRTELLKGRTYWRKVLNNFKLQNFTTSEKSRYFKLIFVSVSFCPCLNLGFLQVLRDLNFFSSALANDTGVFWRIFMLLIFFNTTFIEWLCEISLWNGYLHILNLGLKVTCGTFIWQININIWLCKICDSGRRWKCFGKYTLKDGLSFSCFLPLWLHSPTCTILYFPSTLCS